MEHPGLRVVVAGHADPRGGADANAALAARRAQAVVAELARLGVPVTRLQAVTYGELFADGDLTEAASRRVEFEVAA
jgi:outer membrane protein OmpA-like peptidoglycan-associated protein